MQWDQICRYAINVYENQKNICSFLILCTHNHIMITNCLFMYVHEYGYIMTADTWSYTHIHYIALRHITLPYLTLHFITLHDITLHCIALAHITQYDILHTYTHHITTCLVTYLKCRQYLFSTSLEHLPPWNKGGTSFTPRRFVESLRCAADHLHRWILRTQDNHGCLGHRHFTDLHPRRPSLAVFWWKVGKRVSNRAGWLDFGFNKNHSPWMLFGGMNFIWKGILGWSSKETYMKLYEKPTEKIPEKDLVFARCELPSCDISVRTHRHLDTDTRLGRYLC